MTFTEVVPDEAPAGREPALGLAHMSTVRRPAEPGGSVTTPCPPARERGADTGHSRADGGYPRSGCRAVAGPGGLALRRPDLIANMWARLSRWRRATSGANPLTPRGRVTRPRSAHAFQSTSGIELFRNIR